MGGAGTSHAYFADLNMAGTHSQSDGDHVLFPGEAEAFIKDLKPMNIDKIGSDKWSVQRERIEKLMMQALANASSQSDDFITTLLVSYDKIKVVIHELICIDVWRRKVFPLLFKQSTTPTTGFTTYLVLYHEASIVGLLESVLFYRESCEELNEIIIDLIDYCYRKINELLARKNSKEKDMERDVSTTSETPESIKEDLLHQEQTLAWGIEMKCLSIIHYISDNLKVLPLSVSSRLLNTYDFPCLLVHVLEKSPWSKTDKSGKRLKYENGKWQENNDQLKVAKIQAQVWLTLYRLLMDEDCQSRYEYTQQKKQYLMKLQGHMVDPLVEQIPILADLQRFLHHLSLADVPSAKTALILEQVPIVYDQLLRDWNGKWEGLAVSHAHQLLAPDPAKLKADATRWIDSYNFEALERLSDGPPKCALCGKEATKRCSRCRVEWYCGRECQVKQWKKHKPSCDLLKDASSKS